VTPLSKYIQHFPKPLLDDLIAGRWLPFVGAGFSKNAVLPKGKSIPLWGELGESLSSELEDYSPTNTLDAISAYEHEFGRPKLIERISELLLVHEANPGDAHRAFCSIPFDLVCTTNFDFLLEQQYEQLRRRPTPLIEEDQLSINFRDTGLALLKLHGDLHHPTRMVVSEADYEGFLNRYPLLATFLANLLITRTAVFVGYSLDDPDFRHVWRVVGDRLGRSRRTAYALGVGVGSTDIARFARRGVRVISLPGSKSRYTEIFASAFSELGDYWRDKVIPASQIKEEQPLQELSLPPSVPNRLCFFAVPLSVLALYKDRVFPIVREHGFVPVSADDVASPGDTVIPKIEALIQRAQLAVVDASTPNTLLELDMVRNQLEWWRILVVAPSEKGILADIEGVHVIPRPDIATAESDGFLAKLARWLAEAAERLGPTFADEPRRLLLAKENRAAVITAISLLEAFVRKHVDAPNNIQGRRIPLTALLEAAHRQGLLADVSVQQVLGWLRTRNAVVHSQSPVSRAVATQIVTGVMRVVQRER
jgi:hypothetical protein